MLCPRSLIHGVGQCDWQHFGAHGEGRGNSPVEAVGSWDGRTVADKTTDSPSGPTLEVPTRAEWSS